MVAFRNNILVVASQNDPFFALGKWKRAFPCDEKENFLLQHCSPYQCTHACIIWAQHHKQCLIQHITLVVWTESHETSNMIGHFVKVFSRHDQYTNLVFFLSTMSHNMTPREGFSLFGFFLNLLCPF